MNWSTKEVIDTIINDEGLYRGLRRATPEELRSFFVNGHAPQYLYKSFEIYNGSFLAVDWHEVAEHVR